MTQWKVPLSLTLTIIPAWAKTSILILIWASSHTEVQSHCKLRQTKKATPTTCFLFPFRPGFFSLSIWQNCRDFLSLSLHLFHTSPISCTSSSTAFLWVFLPFMLLHPYFLNWNSSLWNGKLIYFDSSGWQSYPELVVMFLETWQQ